MAAVAEIPALMRPAVNSASGGNAEEDAGDATEDDADERDPVEPGASCVRIPASTHAGLVVPLLFDGADETSWLEEQPALSNAATSATETDTAALGRQRRVRGERCSIRELIVP